MDLVTNGGGDVDEELFRPGLSHYRDVHHGSWYCYYLSLLISTLFFMMVPQARLAYMTSCGCWHHHWRNVSDAGLDAFGFCCFGFGDFGTAMMFACPLGPCAAFYAPGL